MNFKTVFNKKYLILFFIFLLMLVLNSFTPILGDDFGYSLNLSRNKLGGFKDIINYQIIHYQWWGGRTVAHTLAQVFLMFPKSIFNILNSFCFTFLINLIYEIGKDRKQDKNIILLFVFFILYFMLPVFGQDCLWLIGSCNYLWTTTIIIFIVNIFCSILIKKDNFISLSFLFILGCLAGWSNENTGIAVILMLGLFILKSREHIKKWQISGLIGSIMGYIILLLAPGNYIRKSSYDSDVSFIKTLLTRFISCTQNYFKYFWPILGLLVILAIVYKFKKQKIDTNVYIFVVGSLVSLYAMVLSPTFPERAWMGILVFLLIAVIKMLFDCNLNVLNIGLVIFVFLLGINFMFSYVKLLKDIKLLNDVWVYRDKVIKTEERDLFRFKIFTTTNNKNPNYGVTDLSLDKDVWPNNEIRDFYKIKGIEGYE